MNYEVGGLYTAPGVRLYATLQNNHQIKWEWVQTPTFLYKRIEVRPHTPKQECCRKRKLFAGFRRIRHRRSVVVRWRSYHSCYGCEFITKVRRGSRARRHDMVPAFFPASSFSRFQRRSSASRVSPLVFWGGGYVRGLTFRQCWKRWNRLRKSLLGPVHQPFDGAYGYCSWLWSLSRRSKTRTRCVVLFTNMRNLLLIVRNAVATVLKFPLRRAGGLP